MPHLETIWFEVQQRGVEDWFVVDHKFGETDAMNEAGARIDRDEMPHRIRECKCPGYSMRDAIPR
ncbi:hypothetical protein [Actinomadura sp. 9N215]|uniref:hypothetical protein n=1 Tax=Actinomadura sp. 9N215 TaxID=3375150 RepID=UPI0037896075